MCIIINKTMENKTNKFANITLLVYNFTELYHE